MSTLIIWSHCSILFQFLFCFIVYRSRSLTLTVTYYTAVAIVMTSDLVWTTTVPIAVSTLLVSVLGSNGSMIWWQQTIITYEIAFRDIFFSRGWGRGQASHSHNDAFPYSSHNLNRIVYRGVAGGRSYIGYTLYRIATWIKKERERGEGNLKRSYKTFPYPLLTRWHCPLALHWPIWSDKPDSWRQYMSPAKSTQLIMYSTSILPSWNGDGWPTDNIVPSLKWCELLSFTSLLIDCDNEMLAKHFHRLTWSIKVQIITLFRNMGRGTTSPSHGTVLKVWWSTLTASNPKERHRPQKRTWTYSRHRWRRSVSARLRKGRWLRTSLSGTSLRTRGKPSRFWD